MKLYLASYRVPTMDNLISLLGRNPSDTKVAILPNAKDYYSDRVKNIKAAEILSYFYAEGFEAEIVDLLEYNDPDQLQKKLEEYHMIWGNGGNTFCLRYEMKRSGFDQIIKSLLEQGIAYGGESAGAIVAGTSLADIELADDPDYAEGLEWEGLNLIPNYILPHIGNPDFEAANQIALNKRRGDPSLIQLTDDQALIVNGSRQHLTTAL